jgi:ankyrin repeat protein
MSQISTGINCFSEVTCVDRVNLDILDQVLNLALFLQDVTPSPYRKVDINSRGLDGKTALHLASLYGFEQIANVLLKHGAITNISDYNRKCTPLHLACQYNHPKV